MADDSRPCRRLDPKRSPSSSARASDGRNNPGIATLIISQTPLRMSFVGGGSDLPSFYRQFGGAVLSTAIDKYVYVSVNRKFDGGIRLAYSKTEEVACLDEIEHELVR